MNVEERCGCGATFKAATTAPYYVKQDVIDLLTEWRQRHARVGCGHMSLA